MKFANTEMVRDLGYTAAVFDMTVSEDGKSLVTIGSYKPSIKIYDMINLSLKVERHFEAEPLRVIPLTQDASKICILKRDRSIELHAKYGFHESIKVPSVCLDACFNKFKAEIMCAGVGSDIYRFNLEQGRFLKSQGTTFQEILCICMCEANGLICVGGDNKIQFIDQRSKEVIRTVEYDGTPCSMCFSNGGFELGVGTEEGNVYLHDLRARKEICKVSHEGSVRKVGFNGNTLISIGGKTLRCSDRSGMIGEYIGDASMSCFACTGGFVFIGFDNGEICEVISEELGEIPMYLRMNEE
ncbi:hypothetical protein CWI42_090260 [Ordospora colligata]|uniref:Nucleolar protein 10-like N-terminal domain-containing protein n=1 Tax=Ordospora colligata OC4 TaxID=1354746 RepID=A0A0B2UJ65_9MICR|nr:uncharacterized protein M896_090260 [Ordospora colligata OC4]KHN69102.1 hypothetical protein M896_090260 [Ordospora colligata OC4]TBU14557.1 hypothetical protein CWI41_090260 [Ordospora colligata]TBU14751.1 hypothetical protein CWI40_090270 [Ordospora colligata]TBU18185.1 hypothetical protein CWI42_090260 [Ordospora colligata]